MNKLNKWEHFRINRDQAIRDFVEAKHLYKRKAGTIKMHMAVKIMKKVYNDMKHKKEVA